MNKETNLHFLFFLRKFLDFSVPNVHYRIYTYYTVEYQILGASTIQGSCEKIIMIVTLINDQLSLKQTCITLFKCNNLKSELSCTTLICAAPFKPVLLFGRWGRGCKYLQSPLGYKDKAMSAIQAPFRCLFTTNFKLLGD